MNLFATSSCPWQCAIDLDDSRVVNQCRETAQLLCSAIHLRGRWNETLMRPTHLHHPVTKWVALNDGNFFWTWCHLEALGREKRHRYPDAPDHKSWTEYRLLTAQLGSLTYGKPDSFENCAANASLDLDFKHIPDVHLAYREYIKARWSMAKRAPRWTNRRRPEW